MDFLACSGGIGNYPLVFMLLQNVYIPTRATPTKDDLPSLPPGQYL